MNGAMRTAGHSFPRREALDKALGSARYTDDMHLPGMVYGMILRSPHSNARVKRLNVEKSRRMPGVLGILTPADVPDALYNCSGNPPSPLLVPDERVLTDHPKCVGDRVCAVAAETLRQCELALRAIEVEYEQLPAVMSAEEALKDGAPLVQPELSPQGNLMRKLEFPLGDIEAGFAQADHIFEESFYTQPIQHVCMELTGCICSWSEDGRVTIWSPSQTPYQERRILAGILGMSESDIRIIKPVMGGGFGARQQLHNQPVGVLLSRLVRRPVKLSNTREEDMYASCTRHSTRCTMRIGVKNDGSITAAHIENYQNGGPYTTHTPVVCAAAGRKFQYRTDNYLYEGYSVYTNSPTAGAMRGYGNIQVVACREVLMERIARELGYDPVAFRLQNHVGVGDQFPAAGYDILSCGIQECAELAEEKRRELEIAFPSRDDDECLDAWGTAFCCHSSGPSNKDGMSSAIVMANDDGSVTLSIGSADIGQGSETVMAQIAAEELGLPLGRVQVSAADTGVNPYDTGTFASGQTYVCGNAVTRACADLRGKLAETLANLHEIDPRQVTAGSEGYRIGDEGETVPFEQAVAAVAFGMKGAVLIGSASYKALASPPPFAVCLARVRWYRKDRSLRVLDVIEAVDVGTALNPEAVRGQVEGGVSMGVGYALSEDMEFDRRAGKTPVSDLLHYKPPLSVDMPRVHALVAEGIYEPTGPLGAKSVGELAAVPVAPAIVNAIIAASGEPVHAMPVSRQFPVRGWRGEIGKEGSL